MRYDRLGVIMGRSTNLVTEKSPSVSIFRLVFVQSLVTLAGFSLLFGICTKEVLRYQFSKFDDGQLQNLVEQQQIVAKQQQAFDKESFLLILNRVCLSLDCSVEELTSQVTDISPLQSQSIRIVLSTGLYNIPILLDVLRAHPYRFSLDGLEVRTVVDPVQIQVRLSRTLLPDEIIEPEWVSNLGWDESELTRIRVIYKSWLTNRWIGQVSVERQEANVEWTQLYGTLNRDLWRVHQQNGSLVYTPETGIAIRVME